MPGVIGNKNREKDIDWKLFEKLCSRFATRSEISYLLGVSEKTLNDRCQKKYKLQFQQAFERFSSDARVSIRRKQLEVALEGNVTMLIWLGKMYLGQREPKEETNDKVTEVKVVMHPDTIPHENPSPIRLHP